MFSSFCFFVTSAIPGNCFPFRLSVCFSFIFSVYISYSRSFHNRSVCVCTFFINHLFSGSNARYTRMKIVFRIRNAIKYEVCLRMWWHAINKYLLQLLLLSISNLWKFQFFDHLFWFLFSSSSKNTSSACEWRLYATTTHRKEKRLACAQVMSF